MEIINFNNTINEVIRTREGVSNYDHDKIIQLRLICDRNISIPVIEKVYKQVSQKKRSIPKKGTDKYNHASPRMHIFQVMNKRETSLQQNMR